MAAKAQAPDLSRGDEVYARHPTMGAVRVKVLASGKDGFQGTDEAGNRVKVRHSEYLGHKARQLHTYRVIDEGADGTLVEDATGRRRFLQGELPGGAPSEDSGSGRSTGQDDDPLLAGLDDLMKKALRPLPTLAEWMFKAGPIANRPGLVLRKQTDRTGRQSGHWVRSMPKQKHPREKGKPDEPTGKPAEHEKPSEETVHKHGDEVTYRHGGVEGKGTIVASGKDGVTVRDADGRESQVRHEAIDPPHQYAGKKQGEDDRAYLKRTGKDLPQPKHLPEQHDRFFKMDKATATVPVDQLVPTKPEGDKGGDNSPKFMMAAYHGKVDKRDPITVKKRPDGKYDVVDGNGTLAGVKKAGWKELPVTVQGGDTAGKPAQGEMFSAADMAMSKIAHQPVKTRDELQAQIPEAQSQLEALLDKGKGLAIEAGYTHVQGSPEGANLEAPGKQLYIAPPKGMKRATEKVETEYGGDWSRLIDPVRCSLAVDTADEVADAVKMIMDSDLQLARRPNDRFANPTPVGYRDILLNVKMPNGIVGEIQIHLKEILKAKELGHKWYEIDRVLSEKQKKSELSNDEKQKLLAAEQAQRQIYGAAWDAASGAEKKKTEDMSKALNPMGEPYTYFEYENGFYRRQEGAGKAVDDVLHGEEWVPFKGDALAPVYFGDSCPDPLGPDGEIGGGPEDGGDSGDDGDDGETETAPAGKKPMAKALLFYKAQIRGVPMGDLFAERVHVAGHAIGTRYVAPYDAIRHKHHEEPKLGMSDAEADALASDVLEHNAAWRKSYGKNPPLTSPAGWVSRWAHDAKRKLSDADEGKLIEAVFKLNTARANAIGTTPAKPKLEGMPNDAEFIRGRGPISHKWAVQWRGTDFGGGEKLRSTNFFDTQDEALKQGLEWLANERHDKELADAGKVRDSEIVAKLRAGEELTDADLKHLDLKDKAWFEYLSPVVQRLFPDISKAKVREAMGDALNSHGEDPVGWRKRAIKTVGNTRKALANAANYERKPVQVVTRVPEAEPDHLVAGRRLLEGYKARAAQRAARGLSGAGTASDEKSMALWEKRLAADPSKWKAGMGVTYQVHGGRHAQTNRGFRIVSIDPAGKTAILRSVRDTGLTSSGGDKDHINDVVMYLGELKRAKADDRL
jgi:hypothetical protein